MLRAQCGDREALELLLSSAQPALRRLLRGLAGSTDADDLLQEVLVTVYRKLLWLETPELFRPWAFRIASRVAFRHLKRAARRGESPLDDAALDGLPAPEGSSPTGDEMLARLEHLTGLSPASRAVLVLHFQEEMTLPDVAAVLGLPLGTVKSRLAYGLAALRRNLGTERRS